MVQAVHRVTIGIPNLWRIDGWRELCINNITGGSEEFIMSSGGFFLTLVAMLLRVVPFFLIPGLVKSSMSALGNLGAKISNLGNRLSGTATGSIRKSDGFQRGSEFIERNLRGRPRAFVNKRLRKVPGVGKFLTRGSDRRIAGIASKQKARLRADASARAIASGGFLTRGQIKDLEAAAIEAEEEQGIKDAKSGFELSMNTGDYKAVDRKLEEQLNALQKHPDSIEVRRKVKALTKILLEPDDGRGALMKTVRDFAAEHRDSEATSILGKYLGNGENMGKIKGSDQRGLQGLVTDINNGSAIRSALEYGALGTNKLRAGTVGNIDVSALKQQVAAAQKGVLSGKQLAQVTDIYRQALASENAANLINGESLEQINELFKEEYKDMHGSYDGFKQFRLGSSSSDSGTIQVQGSDGGSGGIVSTGNDARPTIIAGDNDELARLSQEQDLANHQRGGRRNF